MRLIEAHPAGPLDDQLIEIVAAVATGDPDPAPREHNEEWNGGSIDSAALNSTRSAAALAIGNILAEEPARLPLAEPALRRLVADSDVASGASALHLSSDFPHLDAAQLGPAGYRLVWHHPSSWSESSLLQRAYRYRDE